MERHPPTQDILAQHSKYIAYQGAPDEEPVMGPGVKTLTVASKACSELVKCGCKSDRGCGNRYIF